MSRAGFGNNFGLYVRSHTTRKYLNVIHREIIHLQTYREQSRPPEHEPHLTCLLHRM